MKIVKDGRVPIATSVILFLGLGAWSFILDGRSVLLTVLCAVAGAAAAFFVYFFRDPERESPVDPAMIVSGADGLVRAIETMTEEKYMGVKCVRISIFLNPFDVHVNRAPIAGVVKQLAYTPGKHLLTISNASSEYNEHSSILIQGETIRCLVKQIVGPIVRRVVYWLDLEQVLAKGDRIGMMKFGSRMDIYLPAGQVQVTVKKGDRVKAGVTVIATLRKDL